MIIDSETKRKLREMNAAELLDAFERLDERTVMPLNHAEVVGLAVDNAYGGYTDAKCFASIFLKQFLHYFSAAGAGAVLLDSSLIPSPPIMPQDRARVDGP